MLAVGILVAAILAMVVQPFGLTDVCTALTDGFNPAMAPLQSYVPDEVIRVLKKSHKALLPGGTCLVMDYMLNDDKGGPLDPAFLNLAGIRKGHYTGRVQSGPEYKEFFEEAGFVDVETDWLTRHQLGFVHGTKAT